MLTEIFKILVEEKLHFHVKILENDEENERMTSLSSQMGGLDPRQEEMVRLDCLMPQSQSVDLMDQMEAGHLGPAVRWEIFSPCKQRHKQCSLFNPKTYFVVSNILKFIWSPEKETPRIVSLFF